jgi:twitching motility protein PilT
MKNSIRPEHKKRDQLLQVMMDASGSDMYITVWAYPWIKISWELVFVDQDMEKMTEVDTKEFAESLMTEEQHKSLIEGQNLDFSFSFSERRFRGNISFQMWFYMIVLRLLNSTIPSVQDMGLTDIYTQITKYWQWLVLVTWPTGSGKTTTLAAMINYINENYKKHIITIEDPIEYVHPHKKSIVDQKEIGRDVPNYEVALMGAMRQNPQVILFWEMRTRKEIEMALTLAETGHLVFSTLHTRSAHQTVSRMIDSFSGPEQLQIRLQIADALIAVFSQRLLTVKDGTRVVMAKEILVKNNAISNLIRENDLHQIPSVIQMSSREWMQLLETDIIQYIQAWIITEEEWFKYANNHKLIKDAVGGISVGLN